MLGGKQGDPRVKRLLDQLELKYTMTPAGDFQLLFGLEGDRSQLVFVDSDTQQYQGLEIREVWAIGHRTEGALSQEMANELLRRNGTLKLGSWRIVQSGSTTYAAFAVHLAADTDGASLRTTLLLVANTADELEKKYSGSDAF